MNELIFPIIKSISLLIGLLGVFFIVSGCIKGTFEYFTIQKFGYQQARLSIIKYLTIGLDFLICKDIIDTLLLDLGAAFWRDLAGLVVVVTIRIALTFMIKKEIEEIERETKQHNT